MLFEKFDYIENDLKAQLKSTNNRLDILEAMVNNPVRMHMTHSPIAHLPEQRSAPFYLNYQMPYQQIPLAPNLSNMNHLDPGVYLNKPSDNLYINKPNDNLYINKPIDNFYLNNKPNDGLHLNKPNDNLFLNKTHENSYLNNPNENLYLNQANENSEMNKANDNEYLNKPNINGYYNKTNDNLYLNKTNDNLYLNKKNENFCLNKPNDDLFLNKPSENVYLNKITNNEKSYLNKTTNNEGIISHKPNNFMSFGPSKITNEMHQIAEREEILHNEYDFLSRKKNPENETNKNALNFVDNNSFFMNNQPMKLENIVNDNYQISPSKKPIFEGKETIYREENFDSDDFMQKTPKKP